MTRVFPIKEWAPSFTDSSRVSTSDFSTTYSMTGSAAEDIFDVKNSAAPPSRFQRRLSSLPFGRDVELADGFEKLSFRSNNQAQDGEKQGGKRQHGGLRNLFRR